MMLAQKAKYNKKLEKLILESINDEVYDYFFKDILDIFNIPIYNSYIPQTDIAIVENLIKTGKLYYSDGYLKIADEFIGMSLSSKIKNVLGVKYNKFKRGYKIDYFDLPVTIKLAIQESQDRAENRAIRLEKSILDNYNKVNNFIYYDNNNTIETFADDLNKNVLETLKLTTGLALDSLAFLQLVDVVRDRITFNIRYHTKYRYENLMKKITKASDKKRLSEQELIDLVKKEVEIAKRHNAIIARNEANIIRGQVTKIQAQASGHDLYIWRTQGDERVRPYHRELNGKTCSFSNPPIVDENNRTANPSEDYNCRCYAQVILDDKKR